MFDFKCERRIFMIESIRKIRKLISLGSLCALAFPALSLGAAGETGSLNVTIYNHGQALVNEIRSMDLGDARGYLSIEFSGVPETINPATLQVRSLSAPREFSVLDMNYEYDLISVKSLLDRYIGKKLHVVLPDPHDQRLTVMQEGILLANNDRPIFKVDGRIYVGRHESVYLAEMPDGLRPRPTLVWFLHNTGPSVQDIEVSYLADGIKWSADYVLKVDRENKKAALSGWVTLENKSGMAFNGASLKLVAGDVNVVRPEKHMMLKNRGVVAEALGAQAMQEEEFFEYHLYNVPRPIDIANRQIKQISLLQAPEVRLEKKLIARYGGTPRAGEIKQKVDVFLEFKNSEKSGLGLPLPKGVVRAYQESLDGSTLFVGEDRLDHTPRDADVKLRMGEAFDMSVERSLVSSEKTGRDVMAYTWEIRVRNSKNEAQKLFLEERIHGDWQVTSSTHGYEKLDAGTIQFAVDVPPSKEQDRLVLTYSVNSRN
jgi:hypothetical protein